MKLRSRTASTMTTDITAMPAMVSALKGLPLEGDGTEMGKENTVESDL